MERDAVPPGQTRIPADAAQRFVADLFLVMKVPIDDTELIAEVLVGADLRGISSHGVARVPYFLSRLQRGVIEAQPRFEFAKRTSTTGVLDADNGIGIVAAGRAMSEAMVMASDHGTGFVVVKDSSHFGYAGFWAERAMRAGFIGISMSNSAGRVAPTHGTDALLGTNPMAVAIPGAPGSTDFHLDMATSAVAVGKVETGCARVGAPLQVGSARPGRQVWTTTVCSLSTHHCSRLAARGPRPVVTRGTV